MTHPLACATTTRSTSRCTSCERATGDPLLLLHGLGERSPEGVPTWAAEWPGAVWAPRLHRVTATRTCRAGGGYTAEVLMGDADAALAQIGPSTVLGRGLGAYVGLLSRAPGPQLVRWRDAESTDPGSRRRHRAVVHDVDRRRRSGASVPPDPFALVELSRDVRPPDYAATFARQVLTLAALGSPLTVSARGGHPGSRQRRASPAWSMRRSKTPLAAYAHA